MKQWKLLVLFCFSFFVFAGAKASFILKPSDINKENAIFFKKLAKSFPKNTQNSEFYTYIIAPHPDDEILCCSQLIQKKLAQNEKVKIVYLTNGDAMIGGRELAKNYGKIRIHESQIAARKMGVLPSDLFFLNFPDQHLADLSAQKIIKSNYTGQTATDKLAFVPFLPYTRQNLENILKTLFTKYPPKEIYLPDEFSDTHPDHQAATKIIFPLVKDQTSIFKYTVHASPNFFSSLSDINASKLDLIRLFRSQFHDLEHRRFLENFALWKENFSETFLSAKESEKSPK